MKFSRLLCWLSLIGAVLLAPAASADESTLEVGVVSELDLQAMARFLGAAEELLPPRDPRRISLDDALQIALEKNLRIQLATLDVDAAEPEVDATRAKFHPVVGADGVVLENRTETGLLTDRARTQDGRVFLRQEVPTGGTLTMSGRWVEDKEEGSARSTNSLAAVEVRQPLMRGGRVYVARRFIYDAEYDLEIQQARLGAEVLDVAAQTKIAYYNAVLSELLIEVVESAIVRNIGLLEASQALFEASRVTKRDVVSAEIQLSKDRIELASRVADRESSQNLLRDVLGEPIGVYLDPTDRHVPFQPIELRVDDWIQVAFTNRPELLEIRKRIDKADLETRVRKNDVLPILDFVGTYQEDYRSGNSDSAWAVGGLFEIPIGNVAARRRLTTARVQQARVEREYVQRERSIELEVREIEIRLRESIRRLEGLIAGVEQARLKREIALARFELGRADNLDITDAEDDLVSAESDLLRAVVDYASNIALLEARIASRI
jgi:outer membrane protein TolC